SSEKVNNLRAMGAEVVQTRSDVQKGHPEYYQDMAARMAQEHGYFYVNQFANPANVAAHYNTTGPEIWEQMDGKLDAFVCGVGSGGTLSGIGRFLKEKNSNVDLVLADPEGSILEPLVNRNETVDAGSWLVEGIGEDFIPDICDIDLATSAYAISDKEAFATARELLVKEGVMVGSSSGTLIAAALRYCREQTTPKRVVTLACDTGNRYLSKLYNDEWMNERGLLEK
ncbi:MAG TPA: cysteine synthase family protein, partial [Pseudidiomarina sp.]|nr:cysteine synthase family protein [Pseudidiomarina sp.]